MRQSSAGYFAGQNRTKFAPRSTRTYGVRAQHISPVRFLAPSEGERVGAYLTIRPRIAASRLYGPAPAEMTTINMTA
jgi:hypothetical protein